MTKLNSNTRANAQPVSPLQQYVRSGLNLHMLQQIKATFDVFDTSRTGMISPADIKSALIDAGKDVKDKPIFQLICDLDQEGGGYIDFERFIFFLTTDISGNETQTEMRCLFKLFDDEKTGFITIGGLRRICKHLNIYLQQQDFKYMMEYADQDKDGFISYEQFKDIIHYQP